MLSIHFYREVAPVDVVAQKQVASLGWVATDFKKLHQVELYIM